MSFAIRDYDIFCIKWILYVSHNLSYVQALRCLVNFLFQIWALCLVEKTFTTPLTFAFLSLMLTRGSSKNALALNVSAVVKRWGSFFGNCTSCKVVIQRDSDQDPCSQNITRVRTGDYTFFYRAFWGIPRTSLFLFQSCLRSTNYSCIPRL